MKRFKVFVNFEKEEQYLREMASKGYHLVKKNSLYVYTFVKGDPSDINYRMDYRSFSNNSELISYVTMFEDAGWEHVYGTKTSYYQYFKPVDEGSDDELFSSTESKAQRYKRSMKSFSIWLGVFILYAVIMFNTDAYENFGFLTPDLWELKGVAFWYSFLFELPFMLFRTALPILIGLYAFMNGLLAVKTYQLYKVARTI